MMMKRVVVLLMIISSCLAAQVINHEIRITLHEDGSAYVEQEYLLRLNDEDKLRFGSLVKNGADFNQLGQYGMQKAVSYASEDENVIIELTQSDFGVVLMQYRVPKIIESVEKIGKQELTGITEKAFTFYDGSTISLPYDPPTTLIIEMPNTLRLAREVTPPAYLTSTVFDANGKKMTHFEWNYREPFTAAKFEVLYEQELPLQSQLSFRALSTELKEKFGSPIYIIAGFVLVAIIVWYRKELSVLVTESFSGEPIVDEEANESS